MNKLFCQVEVETSYFVDAICDMDHDEIIEVIMAIEPQVADLDFTEQLLKRINDSIEAEKEEEDDFFRQIKEQK